MYQYNLFSPEEMKNLENHRNLFNKQMESFRWGIYLSSYSSKQATNAIIEFFQTEQLSLNLGA